ncbi:tatD related deoxyribonuclease, putative [Trypanosoma brucei brucei TREU927]|uniref:TatD related deoxyribonuclease, putative n=2 Tax=Trypanozoon TaxID=39700 RepID=Q386Z4_TRYB2|nr:TatD related deoxyribonuclease [Trypanosoma brucei brucei TREU927]EAN79137.1 tatD related deoxyribonuclease, putative [Trypanosoma brucei brucei TREU927]
MSLDVGSCTPSDPSLIFSPNYTINPTFRDDMRGSSVPCLVDIAVNLTDCVFRGVDWKGRRVHDDNFDEVMRRAVEHNVGKIIITGTSLPQCVKAIRLCRRYPSVLRCTVGVHPAHCAEMTRPMDWKAIEAAAEDDVSIQVPYYSAGEHSDDSLHHSDERMEKLVELVNENRDVVVAVGEIGLDYAELSYCPKEVQREYFIQQFRVLRTLGLPFILHSRDCGMDFVELIEEEVRSWTSETPFVGVVHSYNGSPEEQERLLAIPGVYFSINGSAFREKERSEQVCSIPRDRLMLETDAPWCDIRQQHYGARFLRTQFPTNRRGKPFDPTLCSERRTEPCHLRQVLEAYVGTVRTMGEERGDAFLANITEEEAQEQFYQTCVEVFHI